MARILFVDDDPQTLTMLSKIVELSGHEPMTTVSGSQAVQMAADEQPDLIILDMSMPDLNGIGVIKALRADQRTAHIPAVVLSAGAELDAAQRVQEAGGQEYLQKPLNMGSLLDMIQKYTGSD